MKLMGLWCRICFQAKVRVGRVYYIWHIHAQKWFDACDSLTGEAHWLWQLVDLGEEATCASHFQLHPFRSLGAWGDSVGDVWSDMTVTGEMQYLASPSQLFYCLGLSNFRFNCLHHSTCRLINLFEILLIMCIQTDKTLGRVISISKVTLWMISCTQLQFKVIGLWMLLFNVMWGRCDSKTSSFIWIWVGGRPFLPLLLY